MIRYRCDGCRRDLRRDGSDHYIVRIEAFAAAGRLEFSREEAQRDHAKEIERLIAELEKKCPDEVEDQVYRSFRFDLCPQCHRRFLAAPIAPLSAEAP